MKQALSIVVIFLAFTFLSPEASGQVKINLKKKLNKQADTRANKNTDKALDKGFDKMENGIKGIFKKDDDKAADRTKNADDSTIKKADNQANENKPSGSDQVSKNNSPILSWSKYDFVPGDKIIFEDNLLGEENGEFPSRWDLIQGNVEVAQLNGENVIMFRAGAPRIIPYLKNPDKDYLPDVFTVEFDLFCGDGSFEVFLYDLKNQRSASHSNWSTFKISANEMGWAGSNSKLQDDPTPKKRWVHMAIAYTSGKLKGYMDNTRLVNIPHLNFDPTGITFSNYIFGTKDDGFYFVKNVRIAEGGVKYYDRFLQDGKIVSNGIRFDVGKATLRPESMGVLNEIYTMLDEHPDVKVSIEGHTDSDGDNDLNQKLSEERAETVMKQLVSMGISKERLSSRGYGESKPVSPNDTPEGKASNRRVEFIKTN